MIGGAGVGQDRADGAPWRTLILGSLIYLIVQLVFVGLPGIAGSSEARESQVIKVILRDKEIILPLRNGVIPSKPPLYHWIGATISDALGVVNELTVRLPSQLAASCIIVLVGLVGFRLAQLTRTYQSERHSRRVALLSAGILSLTYGFHIMAAQAMVDMVFVLCMWAAFTSLAFADAGECRLYRRVSWEVS